MLYTIKLFLFAMSCLNWSLVDRADAELLLYIKETRIGAGQGGGDLVTSLPFSEGDPGYDLNTTDLADFIDVNAVAVSAFFGDRWTFDNFYVFSTIQANGDTGLPAQVINMEFSVLKNTGENSRLEVLATFKGINGRTEPTFLQMFGGGRTSQSDLQATFIGSYNHDIGEEFYTNGYVPESTGSEFVYTFSPTPFDDSTPQNPVFDFRYDLLDNGNDPSLSIDGDTTYSLTFGIRLDNLGNGEEFSTASGMDYVLPEPASIATWAAAVGLVGLVGKRKRKARTL